MIYGLNWLSTWPFDPPGGAACFQLAGVATGGCDSRRLAATAIVMHTSPAQRDLRPDGRRDTQEDLRRDEISPLAFGPIEDGETDETIDPWDASDAEVHRKKMNTWHHSKRRVAERHASVAVDRPSLTHLNTDALLLRNSAIPNAVWTIGDGSHGQCGHTAAAHPLTPHPANLELRTLQEGVSGVFAGPHCTIAVTSKGEALGFGAGPFRGAADAPAEAPASDLAYDGAPPFRVQRAGGLSGLGGRLAAGVAASASRSSTDPPSTVYSSVVGDPSFDRTEEAVHARIRQRAAQDASPTLLTGLLMPVSSLVSGDDFCVALMQNGLVFAWGDGEEGKLGLGQPTSQAKPTLVDFLLPTAYAEVAKRSGNKDELLRAGSRLIHTRGRAFQVPCPRLRRLIHTV